MTQKSVSECCKLADGHHITLLLVLIEDLGQGSPTFHQIADGHLPIVHLDALK
jgi:hypothetical protein